MTDTPRFVTSPESADAPVRVYCFPHAGGNPRSFLSWQQGLGAVARIDAFCPPGRLHRFREPAPTDIDSLVEQAAQAVALDADRPFILFGHSLGAVVAFEVARRLRGLPELRHLVVSGCAAPALLPTPRVVAAAELDGREFTEAIGFFGGVPPEVLADEALQELLLPHLRSDFRMIAKYHYRPASPLPLPVTLVNGSDDPHVDEQSVAPWARECTGEIAEHRLPGGHFYFDDRPGAVTAILRPLALEARNVTGDADSHVELI